MPGTRTENDALGVKAVPDSAYYGIHTVRTLSNFNISGQTNSPRLIHAYVLLKKAAAEANGVLGLLPAEIARALAAACNDVLERDGDAFLREQFPVDPFGTGGGINLHMNVNEVLANLALEKLGRKRAEYKLIHPLNHASLSQTTNDTYPAALRIAARAALEALLAPLDLLTRVLAAKGRQFHDVLKPGRPHLQDSMPLRLGHEFAAYGSALKKAMERLQSTAPFLEELGIGGGEVGTGYGIHPHFRFHVVTRLGEWTGFPFRPAEDLHESMQSAFPLADLSAGMKLLALELIRISNDLRLMASGPHTGLNEIILPSIQPGASVLPGNVPPSLSEMVAMAGIQAVGNDAAVALAAQAGQLELNIMLPVVAHNVLASAQLLTNAMKPFAERCVAGIKVHSGRCRRSARTSLGLAEALYPTLGYTRTMEIARKAAETGLSIAEAAVDKGYLEEERAEELLNLETLSEPGLPSAGEHTD